MKRRFTQKIIALILVFSMVISLASCSDSQPETDSLNPAPKVITESVVAEDVITENTITETITSEIYLEEIVVAENKITELLLEEDTINEVLTCSTVYVPQDNIEEYSKNSQVASLFGTDVDVTSLLTKISVGTGVIVTLVVLKMVGLSEPIASIVVAAADESLKFGVNGTAIGSLFGGLTGATDELDKSGRTSAVIGFATATVGLILSIVSLVAAVPSGGTTTLSLAASIKLIIAGVSVVGATAGTAYAGQKAIKTFSSTDSADINWSDIDWEKVGISSVEKSIKNGADGYMWGSIIGAVYGGANGYEFYHKFNTPYTKYNARLNRTPKEGNMGSWTGQRGESDFVLDTPIVLEDGTTISKVTYKNAIPDFSPYALAEVKIYKMTDKRIGSGGNYEKADTALSEYWTKIKYKNKSWTGSDVKTFRENYPYKLTWHEMSNMESMQLVPYELNDTFRHYGGVAEYNSMIGIEGESDYD